MCIRDRYGDVPASVAGLVDISLIRVQAARLGVYEIGQNRDALLLYSDNLDMAKLKPLLPVSYTHLDVYKRQAYWPDRPAYTVRLPSTPPSGPNRTTGT